MARSRDAGYVSAFEVDVAYTEIKDESYKSHSVSRTRTRDRGYVSKTAVAGFVDESFEPIATLLGTGASATISFTSIPATYKHLQIRFIARVTDTDTANNQFVQFNSDTASNYSWHYLEGDGAAVATGGLANQSKMLAGRVSAANATAGIMGVGFIDILDYANTNKYKTIRTLSGQDRNGAGVVRLDSGNWRSTNAITSIQLINSSSTNFTTDSQFALYGIKG